MNELKFTGNSLKGSRPLVTFDKSFDSVPHLQLLKEMFSQVPINYESNSYRKGFWYT